MSTRSEGVFAEGTYRVVDGFQGFPLGLVLGLQLVVGVLVELLDFLNHLRWADKRQADRLEETEATRLVLLLPAPPGPFSSPPTSLGTHSDPVPSTPLGSFPSTCEQNGTLLSPRNSNDNDNNKILLLTRLVPQASIFFFFTERLCDFWHITKPLCTSVSARMYNADYSSLCLRGHGGDLHESLAQCLVQSKSGISISHYNMMDNYSPLAPGYSLV